MIIIGCDWQVRFEQMALLDTETGEVVSRGWSMRTEKRKNSTQG